MKAKVHSTHESCIVAPETLPQPKKAECFLCISYHLRNLIYIPFISISIWHLGILLQTKIPEVQPQR